MTKYRITQSEWGDVEIKKIEVESETKDFVIIEKGRRRKKITDYECYYDNFEMAKIEYIKYFINENEGHKRQIENLKGTIGKNNIRIERLKIMKEN